MAVQAQPRVVKPEPHERQQEVHLNMIFLNNVFKTIVLIYSLFFCSVTVHLYQYASVLQ